MEKMKLEGIKLNDYVKDCRDDLNTVREYSKKLDTRVKDFEDAVNSDIGGLKGSNKWAEDQINMIKKMMQRLNEQTGGMKVARNSDAHSETTTS